MTPLAAERKFLNYLSAARQLNNRAETRKPVTV
jgi:hypothetical protein